MKINPHSMEWELIRAWNLKRIDALRDDIERDLDPDKTTHLRGMIAVLREQIEEFEPTPKPIVKDANYG